ncbi:Sucrase/ferredoxin-like-domain-containing protein [Xylaria bambusicola]|uniref:Sucrase/ferredoxin-like-domain-containing protein n=1 Tax=Xylaria bambusicola TaxID=326684 RepID=UPI002008054D|nr:Sucrase/ferredoxin-like-domain-containing protein [Xylaria bambusicola]KAI0515456.1 Sucrase/ferredoxin-like-domain-containing protein [Xylaria bambusicola]
MSLRQVARTISRPIPWSRRTPRFSLAPTRSLNTVPRCPSPTCDCAETPEMPEGLPIDYDGKLSGLISSYAEQVVVCTGQKDWSSRIEEENSGDNLAADLKELLGRGGIYSDPFHNISVLNSSFPSSISRRPEIQSTSAYLLPSFKYVPFLPRVSFEAVQALVKGYLLPEKLHPMNDGLPQIHKDRLVRKEAYQHLLPGVRDVEDVLVLICGHGGRDMRCGVMGPVLLAEFETQLPQAGFEVLHGPVLDESISAPALPGTDTAGMKPPTARVGLISHIGGHKFAGNIIIYLPPAFKNSAGNTHPLAGHGVWYGRIEPKHVEGVVQETILGGNVIADHFRGAIKQNGEILRPQWVLPVFIFAASAGVAYLYRRQSPSPDDDVINTSTFSAFTITRREQVSPTAFIITLRPSAWVTPQELESGRVGEDDGQTGVLSSRIQEAWNHGLWSVEIKQPQLQIARHYTPLPPLPALAGSEPDEQADLRFLIRRMDGGEMSNYLSRQSVGDTLWLRGPHLGFDVLRRLGNDSGATKGDAVGPRRIVFLAGGTGVAPALQIAHKVLDGTDYNDGEKSRPHISILWANRWGADTLGREQSSIQGKPSNWFRFWGVNSSSNPKPTQEKATEDLECSLALQIRELKRRHPSHFDISYFVDNEGSFIEARDIKAALASTAPSTVLGARVSSSSCKIDRSCAWHSQKAVELLPNDNDFERSSSSDFACMCAYTPEPKIKSTGLSPGVNLVGISGPDGFIEAYAGPKRWHDGNEMQGTIRGLLGKIWKDEGHGVGDWLVLKL